MAIPIIRPNATIRDVRSTLASPDEYVRVVLEHLMACLRQHGNAFVRIGVTGRGTHPSHKVVYEDSDGSEVLFKAYAERTPFTENIQIHTWSTERMSLDEVKELLGEIRGFKRNVM